jgi:uncharacterized protein YbdZ (MbtH family)
MKHYIVNCKWVDIRWSGLTSRGLGWQPVVTVDTRWIGLTPGGLVWHPVDWVDTRWSGLTPSGLNGHPIDWVSTRWSGLTLDGQAWHPVDWVDIRWSGLTPGDVNCVKQKMNCSVGWHDYKTFTLNFAIVAHNYGIQRENRRRIINIWTRAAIICRILAICNRTHGSMIGPPVHSRSPVAVHSRQIRHFICSWISELPGNEKKTITVH